MKRKAILMTQSSSSQENEAATSSLPPLTSLRSTKDVCTPSVTSLSYLPNDRTESHHKDEKKFYANDNSASAVLSTVDKHTNDLQDIVQMGTWMTLGEEWLWNATTQLYYHFSSQAYYRYDEQQQFTLLIPEHIVAIKAAVASTSQVTDAPADTQTNPTNTVTESIENVTHFKADPLNTHAADVKSTGLPTHDTLASSAATPLTTTAANTASELWHSLHAATGNQKQNVQELPPNQVKSEAPITAVKYMQGRREKQEDRHILLDNLVEVIDGGEDRTRFSKLFSAASLYALFDGHCGSLASDFCAQILAKQIATYLCKPKAEDTSNNFLTEEEIRQRITSAFVRTDKEFLTKYRVAKDGCTAVVSLRLDNTLYVASLGDSRAVLGKLDRATNQIVAHRLIEDHKPNRLDEQQRIQDNGGVVLKQDSGVYRVAPADYEQRVKRIKMETCTLGSSSIPPPILLAVSRAFGDRELKLAKLLSNIPEIRTLHLSTDDKFIVMACDGVWDVLSDQDVITLVYENIRDVEEATSAVVRNAFKKGSQDNLTAMTLILNG